MSTVFASRLSTQRSAMPASTSKSVNSVGSLNTALASPLRLHATSSRPSRAVSFVPLAYRGSGASQWGGRSYPGRGAFGPFAWQFGGNPMTQATLEDLAKQFGFSMNPSCSPGRGSNQQNNSLGGAFIPFDFEEQDSRYLLTADVPGLQKADLKITVNKEDRSLKVSGERRRPEATEDSAQESRASKQRFERRMGKFQRSFPDLPEDADLAAVTARVDKGVLSISIKKLPEVQKPENTINIDIE